MITHSAKETWQQKEQWRWGWRWQGRLGGAEQHFEKEGYAILGGLHKLTALAPFCQLCKETLEISHPSYCKTNPPTPIPGFPPHVKQLTQLSHLTHSSHFFFFGGGGWFELWAFSFQTLMKIKMSKYICRMKTKLLYDLNFFTKICWNMYFELFTTGLKSAPVHFLVLETSCLMKKIMAPLKTTKRLIRW